MGEDTGVVDGESGHESQKYQAEVKMLLVRLTQLLGTLMYEKPEELLPVR